jgi:hypothetical protein
MKRLFLFILLLASMLGASPAHATLVYSSNNSTNGFDATTTGTAPAGWTAVSGTWNVGGTLVLPGHTHTLSDTTHTDGHIAIYNGNGTNADMEITYATTISSVSSPNVDSISSIIRSDSSYTNAYICLVNQPTTVALFKKVSGTVTQIGSSIGLGFTVAANDVILHRFSVQGTNIKCKIWKSTQAEPSSPQISTTDSSVAAAGYAGLFNGDTGTGTTNAVSDIDINSINGTTYNAPKSPTAVSSVSGNITVSGVYTGTAPSGLNYALDGGSFGAASSPTISGGTFSFTIAAPTNGYHEIEVQNSGATGTTGSGVFNTTNGNNPILSFGELF